MHITKKASLCLVAAAVLLLGALSSAPAQNATQHTDHKAAPGGTGGQMGGQMGGQSGGQMGGMPMMQGGMDMMGMMQGHMARMMDDMKSGRMMQCMMGAGMMQAMMGDRMRQAKDYSDKAFLSAMIPHHEAAVAMAKAVLKNGKDPRVKKWAEEVVSTQESEIERMQSYLTGLGGEDAQAAAAMKESMRAMTAAPMNADPDVNFVSMMIGHHASAVSMALGAATASQNESVIKLAGDMGRAQLEEIVAYRTWLKEKGQ